MKKFMMDTKATFGLVSEKTVDEDYNKHSASLKALHEALSTYNNSMDKTKYAMKELMKSMGDVSNAFEKLNNDESLPENLKDFSTEFKQAIEKIEKVAFVEYIKSMETNVTKASGTIRAPYDECIRLENQRHKTVNEYDVYRDSVNKKELEYSKKGKDLKDSKSYQEEVKKRDELKAKYEADDNAFKKEFELFKSQTAQNNTVCVKEFCSCTSSFLLKLSQEMERLNEISKKLAA